MKDDLAKRLRQSLEAVEIGSNVQMSYEFAHDLLGALSSAPPAVTSQSVGRERLVDALRGNLTPIIEWDQLWKDDKPRSQEEADRRARRKVDRDNAVDRILAALTAEPASKAIKCSWCNDTGWTIGNGTVREGCLSCDAQLNMIRAAEPASKAEDAVKQLLKTAIDALSHFDPITAGVLQSSYALTNLPSPQPDMGSGDPTFLEDARQMGTFTLLDCIETAFKSHTMEDNSTARLAVAELRRREQLKVDRAKKIRKFKEIE